MERLDETDIDWETFPEELQDQEETDVDLGKQIRQQGKYNHISVYIYLYINFWNGETISFVSNRCANSLQERIGQCKMQKSMEEGEMQEE